MVAKIDIGNATVEMVANAATPIRYRSVFGEDIIKVLLAQEKEVDTGAMADAASKLAYIMKLQAEKSDFRKASMDDFILWLEDFSPMDMIMAAGDIMTFYNSQTSALSTAKKKDTVPSEK